MSTPNLIWHKIADSSDLLAGFLEINQVKAVKVEGKFYCIGRLGDAYYAITNQCPHAGGPLGQGHCDAHGNVVCPFHRYKFNLKTGRNVSGQGYYVDTFPTETREDGLYIGLKKKKWWMF